MLNSLKRSWNNFISDKFIVIFGLLNIISILSLMMLFAYSNSIYYKDFSFSILWYPIALFLWFWGYFYSLENKVAKNNSAVAPIHMDFFYYALLFLPLNLILYQDFEFFPISDWMIFLIFSNITLMLLMDIYIATKKS